MSFLLKQYISQKVYKWTLFLMFYDENLRKPDKQLFLWWEMFKASKIEYQIIHIINPAKECDILSYY